MLKMANPWNWTQDQKNSRYTVITVGRVLIAWFNDCALGKSGQIANPIIAMVDPVPCYSVRARLCLRIY